MPRINAGNAGAPGITKAVDETHLFHDDPHFLEPRFPELTSNRSLQIMRFILGFPCVVNQIFTSYKLGHWS